MSLLFPDFRVVWEQSEGRTEPALPEAEQQFCEQPCLLIHNLINRSEPTDVEQKALKVHSAVLLDVPLEMMPVVSDPFVLRCRPGFFNTHVQIQSFLLFKHDNELLVLL